MIVLGRARRTPVDSEALHCTDWVGYCAWLYSSFATYALLRVNQWDSLLSAFGALRS